MKQRNGSEEEGVVEYAGFGTRLYAYLIDQSLIQVVSLLIVMPYALKQGQKIWDSITGMMAGNDAMMLSLADSATPDSVPAGMADLLVSITLLVSIFVAVLFVVGLIYGTLMEASESGATLGKRYCGLRVTTEYGDKIGYGAALLRNIGVNLISVVMLFDSLITLLVLPAYLTPLFLKKRQTFYDLAVRAIVVKES